jgi:hypothetical protein
MPVAWTQGGHGPIACVVIRIRIGQTRCIRPVDGLSQGAPAREARRSNHERRNAASFERGADFGRVPEGCPGEAAI